MWDSMWDNSPVGQYVRQQSCGTVCETSHVGQYVGQQSCGTVCGTTVLWDSM